MVNFQDHTKITQVRDIRALCLFITKDHQNQTITEVAVEIAW